MIKKIFLIAVCSTAVLFAQDAKVRLDSLYSQYVQIKQGQTEHIHTEEVKCAFSLVNRVRTNYESFDKEQQKMLNTLFSRIPRDKSIISPAGYFRVHYNLVTAAPKYVSNLSADANALEAAKALDSAYNYQVNYLGYPPPRDNGQGGDDLYDVYIDDIGGGGTGYYGYTEFENEIIPGSKRYNSFMVIDDDYSGFYSSGIAGLRVTVAHELHHGIQVGNYIYRDSDSFYFEATSTAMEEFVFDTVNDYYAYMNNYFQNSYLPITQQNGYNIAILNIYLENRFDHNLLKRIWELMPQDSALNAINKALIEQGSSFDTEYNMFGVWTFFTKHRAVEGRFFEEGRNYPLIRPLITMNFTAPEDTVTGNSKPCGNNFVFFINGQDTLVTVISNSDIMAAYSNPQMNKPYRYILYNYPEQSSIKLADNYYMKFLPETPAFWNTSEILNKIIVRGGEVIVGVIASDDYASPPDNKGQFIITRTGDDSQPLTVELIISGTAVADLHYNTIPSIVEIPAGESRIYLDVIPLPADEELDKTVIVNVNESQLYGVGTQGQAVVLIDYGSPLSVSIAYPSPFRYSRNTLIYIPVDQTPSGKVDFNVFSTGMDLIYSNTEIVQLVRGSVNVIIWNPLNNNKEKLASGVYIYMIKSGDEVKKGKLLIFND